VQIDFDELYESNLEFKDIWSNVKRKKQEDIAIQGHEQIKQNIDQHFLFPVGWDYFPICERDWQGSMTNVEMKSGFEVLMNDHGDELKNVFQFNLAHRVLIFSEPVGHPRTCKKISLNVDHHKLIESSHYHLLPCASLSCCAAKGRRTADAVSVKVFGAWGLQFNSISVDTERYPNAWRVGNN